MRPSRPGRRRCCTTPNGRRRRAFVRRRAATGRHRDHHGRRRCHRHRPGVADPAGGDMSTATTPGTRRSEPDTDAAAKRVAASRSGRRGRSRGRGGWWTRRRREPRTKSRRCPAGVVGGPGCWRSHWCVVLLAGAVYAVFFSPLLGVAGCRSPARPTELTAKVRAVVDVPDGTPLARVDLDGDRGERRGRAGGRRGRGRPELAGHAGHRRDAAGAGRGDVRQRSVLAAGRAPAIRTCRSPAPPAGMITVQLVAPGAGDPSTSAALAVAAALTPRVPRAGGDRVRADRLRRGVDPGRRQAR